MNKKPLINTKVVELPQKGKSSASEKCVSLDTLAQLATSSKKEDDIKLIPCTHESDKKTLQKRAYRKYINTSLSLRLVDASKINPKSTLQKSYFNSYHCCKTIAIHSSGKVKGNYCKNRWCLVCNSIRTAVLIHKYMPVVEDWNDKYFVTLTLPNCDGRDLRATIDEMQKVITQIRKVIQKRYQRGKGEKFIGVRKLECTYNPKTNKYHPHYHFVIDGHDNASELLNIWLKKVPAAKAVAQDIRPADDNSSKELFKYFTKVVTTIKDKNGDIKDAKIYADAMDVIFNSIKGLRTFQNFGFKTKNEVLAEDFVPAELSGDPIVSEAVWVQELADWAEENGELLSGYIPLEKTKRLVNKKIIVRDNFHTRQIKIFNNSS